MKILVFLVVAFAAGVAFAEGFHWSRYFVGPYIVDEVSGHGKTCYVLVMKDPGTHPVLLWCE